MALLASVLKRSWQLFSSQCSGFQGAATATEHHLRTGGKAEFLGSPSPSESETLGAGPSHKRSEWFWRAVLMGGWNVSSTIGLPSPSARRFCVNIWSCYSMLYLQYLLCFSFEHTHELCTNPGVDFYTGLCLFYRIYVVWLSGCFSPFWGPNMIWKIKSNISTD